MGLWSLVRWLRAAGFAATCAGLAAAGHLAGGGAMNRPALLVGFAITFLPALVLTRREHTFGTILPAVAACQVVLHTLLSQTSPGHPAPPLPVSAAQDLSMPASHGGSPGLDMLLMHAVAVLVTSWWLERGEARLCDLVRRAATWALRPFVRIWIAPVRIPPPAIPAPWAGRPLTTAVLRHVMVRRGPPPATVALS